MRALKNINQIAFAVALMIAGPACARAGALRKLWQLDLRKIIAGAPGPRARRLPVQLIRFSPDGRQLAVAVAWNTSQKIFKSQLLVIEAQPPPDSVKQFEISAGIGNEEMPGPDLFGWSPNGNVIFAGGRVIHLRESTSCEAPHGWVALIDDNHLVLNQPDAYDGDAIRAQMDAIEKSLKASGGRPIQSPPGPPERKSTLKFFDSECQPQKTEWQVAERWEIHDVSIERGLLAVTRNVGFLKNEFLIIDLPGMTVIHRWPPGSGIGGQFADGGKAVCNGGDVEQTGRAQVTCWDVDTGAKIGEARTINGGAPMATAIRSSRIVASDYQRVRDPASSYEYAKLFKRRVVWDFRESRELASWRPELQSYIDTKKMRVEEPFKFAISPDGQYVAEGGNGIIRLLKIEP